jgi:hypothetical protein
LETSNFCFFSAVSSGFFGWHSSFRFFEGFLGFLACDLTALVDESAAAGVLTDGRDSMKISSFPPAPMTISVSGFLSLSIGS